MRNFALIIIDVKGRPGQRGTRKSRRLSICAMLLGKKLKYLKKKLKTYNSSNSAADWSQRPIS
jgi:hypothetical protein